ncbi:MAG: carbon starvation protein A [Gemmatimonadaceae bacterium]|nr:carbon starvation protein A [Gemmatimonadaceae bacterium]
MRKLSSVVTWTAVALAGAVAFAWLALSRGETISAAWLLVAAVSAYLVSYRFYSRFITARIFALDPARPTPATRLSDGCDFVPTHKWIVFGHHFATIAGPGPLVGPTLAAQFGFLPGALWIIVGVAVAGAVQDMVILAASIRRDGKSLGQMARDEIGPVAGVAALLAVLGIMIIIVAVLGLVVVNALKVSPWGTATVIFTMPVAMFVGVYMRYIRPGRIIEASMIGLVLLILAVYAGQWVADSATLAPMFTWSGTTLAWSLMAYGLAAAVLPVWLLLAPRDYISAFVKIGVVLALAIGVLILLPPLQMPAVTQFTDGTGPIFAGKVFPFAFVTIACGAISGFHSLVASGTTPKMIQNEADARVIGFGAMLTESLVAILALIAACVLEPGLFFAINSPVAAIGTTSASAAQAISSWGFTVTPEQIDQLSRNIQEQTVLSRTGGAPSLAIGMATIFSSVLGGASSMAVWYHFAIMFEALFVLTVLDSATRIGRFIVQDIGRHVWAPLGRTSWYPAVIISSAIFVAMWGNFLYQGVIDPLGGINSLWPLFGISNQLLAAIALCVGTTIIIKMGKARFAWVTLVPLAWVTTVTLSAGWIKIFAAEPRLGFLAHARWLSEQVDSGALPAGIATVGAARHMIFNDYLNALVAGVFMVAVIVVLVASARELWLVLSGRKVAVSTEVPMPVSRAA